MYCKSGSVHGRVPAALCVPTEVILVTYKVTMHIMTDCRGTCTCVFTCLTAMLQSVR